MALLVGACTPGEGGAWTAPASMSTARTAHTATVLTSSGRVLVAGGANGSGPLRSVERYDPGADTWVPLAPMGSGRSGHTATELADGRVLVAGGTTGATAEVYDRAADRWTSTGAMKAAHSGHGAARLTNGRVLVADHTSAELFNPATGTWSSTGPLPQFGSVEDDERVTSGPYLDGLLALPSGRALAVLSREITELPQCPGVCSSSWAETATLEYRTSTNQWAERPDMKRQRARTTVAKLSSGRILVAGGITGGIFGDDCATGATEVYDPSTQEWLERDGMTADRTRHAATLLPDGRVLVSGGFDAGCDDASPTLSSAELYDPDVLGFTNAASMGQGRRDHEAVRLGNGRVLVVGGTDASDAALASAELYTPG